MSRAPDWTEEEFKKLVANHTLSNIELAKQLPTRSVDAIDIVRGGIHAFHQGKDDSVLSQMMQSYLKRKKHSLTCAKCGATF